MKFEEVLPLLRQGKKIRLADWHKDDYLREKDGHIMDDMNCSIFNKVYSDDFLREDWVVEEE